MTHSQRIDVHHHLIPPGHQEWLHAQGFTGPPLPAWSPAAALATMGRQGAATAILSLSTPGVHLGDDAEARRQARQVNEYAATVVKDHPGRFGFFATLTLPDVKGAVAEAEYAFDVLGADGVILLANTRGTYLGDPAAEALWSTLDDHGAVVLIHPGELPAPPVPGVPPVVADYLLDTTRAALSLVSSGTLARYQKVKVILPHGGGFLPYIAFRAAPILAGGGDPTPVLDIFRRFYFDTGLTTTPAALPSLLAFASPDRIVHGSDWPYAPEPFGEYFGTLLREYPIDDLQRTRMDRGNAAALFPRLTQS